MTDELQHCPFCTRRGLRCHASTLAVRLTLIDREVTVALWAQRPDPRLDLFLSKQSTRARFPVKCKCCRGSSGICSLVGWL